jgi:nucleotide-binding universal stress UspA family protein/hemerythrin-like domain-containing protein
MYRHLLVPIDGTDLATETIGQAVEFARTLGARITFLHAVPDHASSLTGESEVVRFTAPAEYEYAYVGRAQELLAKAEAAARALGVPCSRRAAVSNVPHDAIVEVAREIKCDLIFMASHGRRSQIGMMLGSETIKVLLNAGIPVLVAATSEPAAPARAIAIVRDEHRSLAAVLHAWMHLIDRAHAAGSWPDRTLMRAIVRYIQAFPVELHHPKEDEYLFKVLRERAPHIAPELDELESQHARDRQLVAELAALIDSDPGTSLDALAQAVQRYAAFIWEHLGREEGVILPAAHRYLTADDWQRIDTAFSENRDPRFGGDTDREFKRLFSRIVNLSQEAPGADQRAM